MLPVWAWRRRLKWRSRCVITSSSLFLSTNEFSRSAIARFYSPMARAVTTSLSSPTHNNRASQSHWHCDLFCQCSLQIIQAPTSRFLLEAATKCTKNSYACAHTPQKLWQCIHVLVLLHRCSLPSNTNQNAGNFPKKSTSSMGSRLSCLEPSVFSFESHCALYVIIVCADGMQASTARVTTQSVDE